MIVQVEGRNKEAILSLKPTNNLTAKTKREVENRRQRQKKDAQALYAFLNDVLPFHTYLELADIFSMEQNIVDSVEENKNEDQKNEELHEIFNKAKKSLEERKV